jgi:predicted dinucleotide-binding enzyme
MDIGVIGSGTVGETLANGFLKHGHRVMRGSRDPEKLASWAAGQGASASTGDFAATTRFGEIVVLAVKGTAAEDAVRAAGVENLAGKTVIDTTNPLAPSAPEKGVLRFFTSYESSLMERLQLIAPKAHFVKAFSCVGSSQMIDPQLPGGPPTMFICGDSAEAKRKVALLLREVGWDSEDMGSVEAARAIEPLCILWCIPGFLRNQWTHAFKLLRP